MKKILVADDDHAIVLALTKRLQSEGYTVITAHDGLTAIQKARAEKPDVVLADVSMPAGSGIFVLETLQASPETMAIPVILMTAKESSSHFDAAMEGGACGYLQKPFEDGALVSLIDSTGPLSDVRSESGLVSWDITILA